MVRQGVYRFDGMTPEALSELICVTRDMGRNHHIVEFQQRVIGWSRFLFGHVEAGRRDLALL